MALRGGLDELQMASWVELGSTGVPAQRTVLYDASGNPLTLTGGKLPVTAEAERATYSALGIITLAASAGEVAALPGNASNIVRVTRIILSGVQTTAGSVVVYCVKRVTPASGGTSSNLGVSRHDTGDGLAASQPVGYSANPTTGTSGGNFRAAYMYLPAAATVPGIAPLIWDFLAPAAKPMTLRGADQSATIFLAGATVTGGSLAVVFEWTESAT